MLMLKVYDDFDLTIDKMFSRQYHASITDVDNLILFDNGNEKQTRILEFNLDE